MVHPFVKGFGLRWATVLPLPRTVCGGGGDGDSGCVLGVELEGGASGQSPPYRKNGGLEKATG